MKKIHFFIFFLVLVCKVNAQVDDKALAIKLVSQNMDAIGLSDESLNNALVSSTYEDPSTKIRMVYLQQGFKGLPVYNQLLVLAFRNEKLISKSGAFNQSLEKFVNVPSGIPVVPAQQAVRSALSDRKLQVSSDPVEISMKNNGRFVEFDNMGLSRENITAELMWLPIEKTGEIRLAWQVYIIPQNSSDYWLVRMDATNNQFLAVDNLTSHDNWDHPAHNDVSCSHVDSKAGSTSIAVDALYVDFNKTGTLSAKIINSPLIVNTATYRVIPFPAESPNHPGGTPALRSNPWTAAPGNATSLKWHTGLLGANYDYSRGNNVWAYQDNANTITGTGTGTIAKSASSTTTPDPLTFDFVPNFSVAPTQSTPVQNQQFNITNLFYWNNIIHDVMYQYGFTETTGNFQDDNQGRGGAGNDHVNAEAQDGSGTNNANFSTPVDGGSGRMQMYLWSGTPAIDGDVDNGIIVHEYGHGISTRLTGGPANSSCLQNSEQMGEGWSDYYSLMFTQDWASATLNTGFASPRGIGTYALNQPNSGAGIRPARYCTNMAVNNYTYANLPSMAVPHGVGFIWCTTLWDMTWNIINQVGSINPNIYDANGGGGNTIAMRLVTEGIRLQQCSPGFISGRNAILQADQNLYGGAYNCSIIAAFARRGMGTNAAEGSTSNNNDQTVDFTGAANSISVALTQNGIISVPEGQNIIYNNKVTASSCYAIANYILRDTLPLNVSFVSATNGGTYNAGNRVVSWNVNLAAGASADYGFTVNINAGTYFPSTQFLNEPVASTTIAASWTTSSTTANVWTAHNVRSKSAPNSFFTPNAAVVSDQVLATTSSMSFGATPMVLSFWHWYNTENTYDGAVLEISTNGGTNWSDIGAANIIQNGYTTTLSNAYSNPLGGRSAWSGNSNAFVETKVSLAAYVNQANVKLRWRLGSDNTVAATGWNIDDILLQESPPVINMRTSLFNNAAVRVMYADTVTVVTAPPITAANLNLKMYIQGYYQNPSTAAPMDNFGAGGCAFITGSSANSADADNVSISLMNAVNGSLVESKTGMLHTDGTLSVSFGSATIGNSYYIRIRHRNSMETWSASPVTIAAVTSYDFTTAANKAYGNNMAEVEPGVWAIYSGDIIDAETNTSGVQDAVIESSDYSQMENEVYLVATGYIPTDITGDGVVESLDYSIMENNVYLVISVARPF